MKGFILALGLGALSFSTNASLVPVLNGQAYYDDVLDMTWLTDANYAKTSGYDLFGHLTWADANAFIDSLNDANYLTFNDWRLPNMDINGDNVITPNFDEPRTDAELKYLNTDYSINRSSPEAAEPFTNLQPMRYWSSTLQPPSGDAAFALDFSYSPTPGNFNGNRPGSALLTEKLPVWVVRSGNSVVPIPAAVYLFGSALGLLGWMRRGNGQHDA